MPPTAQLVRHHVLVWHQRLMVVMVVLEMLQIIFETQSKTVKLRYCTHNIKRSLHCNIPILKSRAESQLVLFPLKARPMTIVLLSARPMTIVLLS